MEFVKQYIVQCISAASNNLRLNNQKIEVVALLRDAIIRSEDIESDLRQMKKITELSTLAIRLHEIYNFLNQGQLDFIKISDNFKQHAQYLIKDLTHMLEVVNPSLFRAALGKISNKAVETPIKRGSEEESNNIHIDLSPSKASEKVFTKSPDEEMKENLILEEDKSEGDILFQNYEDSVLKNIKPTDELLKKILNNETNLEEIDKFISITGKNAEISNKIGFEIIANMHQILNRALILIKTKALIPGKEIIESMRACLIVIAAVIRGKEVDITMYLNKAEEFGRKIQNLKLKETD